MSYKLINANSIRHLIAFDTMDELPCIYADLPNGLDGGHYKLKQEPKTGHWIDNNNGTISCSYCHTWFYMSHRYSYMRYCPYCGAKMAESEGEE